MALLTEEQMYVAVAVSSVQLAAIVGNLAGRWPASDCYENVRRVLCQLLENAEQVKAEMVAEGSFI